VPSVPVPSQDPVFFATTATSSSLFPSSNICTLPPIYSQTTIQKKRITMSETTGDFKIGTTTVKKGLAQMLKGGVIMDVMNVEQAKISEAA